MTTTEPSGEACPVPSSPSSSSTSSSNHSLWPPCSSWPSSSCLRKRKEKLCRTDLPVRSAPGVWLLVGVCVVLVGMCVAVAGYASASTPRPLQGGRGASHADRMKLAGPVVMGVGLFVFICSATLLYENRDSALMLTLRREHEEDGCPVVVVGGDEEDEEVDSCSPQRPCCSCREREPRHLHHHHHHREQPPGEPEQRSWTRSLSLAPSICGDHGDEDDEEEHDDADDNGVSSVREEQRGQGESPSLIGGHGRGRGGGGGREDGQKAAGVMVVEVEVEEEEEGGARLLTCVVHHQEPPGLSSCSSPPPSHCLDPGSCNSSEIDFNVRTLLTPALP